MVKEPKRIVDHVQGADHKRIQPSSSSSSYRCVGGLRKEAFGTEGTIGLVGDIEDG